MLLNGYNLKYKIKLWKTFSAKDSLAGLRGSQLLTCLSVITGQTDKKGAGDARGRKWINILIRYPADSSDEFNSNTPSDNKINVIFLKHLEWLPHRPYLLFGWSNDPPLELI